MKNEIKCIFFDLGNVITGLDVNRLEKAFVEKFSAKARPNEVIDYYENSKEMALYTEGRIDSSRFFSRTKRRFRLKTSFSEFYEVWNSIFITDKKISDLIYEIKDKNRQVSLGILSNTNESHYSYLKENIPVLGEFDLEVLSFKVASQKPQKAIYTEAVKKAGFPAKNCFFTDDLQKNIKTARMFGMRAYVFKGALKLRKDLVSCSVSL